MSANDKQSEIRMVKEFRTCKGKFQELPSLMGEKFAAWNKILPVHHGCNPNGQEYSHKLKIRTAFTSNRTMNFGLEIKLYVNSFWFRLCQPTINNLKSEWSRNLELVRASSKNCLHWWERNLLPEIKYCQCTMAAIQMVKNIRINSKFEQLSQAIGPWTSVSK